MQVVLQDLLDNADVKEPVYPGKKVVKKYTQAGEYKSHCVVFDWRDSDKLHVELKAGLTGRELDAKDLRKYPVSFQAPTYLDIEMDQDNVEAKEDDEEDETEGKGKSGGGGGKKPAQKKLEEVAISMSDFSRVTEGDVPEAGQIEKFVVMGKELAQEAYAQAFENLRTQLSQAKVMAMDLMKDIDNVIKRAMPSGGLAPKGDETLKYKYDSERNAPMFGGMAPS